MKPELSTYFNAEGSIEACCRHFLVAAGRAARPLLPSRALRTPTARKMSESGPDNGNDDSVTRASKTLVSRIPRDITKLCIRIPLRAEMNFFRRWVPCKTPQAHTSRRSRRRHHKQPLCARPLSEPTQDAVVWLAHRADGFEAIEPAGSHPARTAWESPQKGFLNGSKAESCVRQQSRSAQFEKEFEGVAKSEETRGKIGRNKRRNRNALVEADHRGCRTARNGLDHVALTVLEVCGSQDHDTTTEERFAVHRPSLACW